MIALVKIKTDNNIEKSYLDITPDIFNNNMQLMITNIIEKFGLDKSKKTIKQLLVEKQFGQIFLFPSYWTRYKKISTPINIVIPYIQPKVTIKTRNIKINHNKPFITILSKHLFYLLENGIKSYYKESNPIVSTQTEVLQTIGQDILAIKLTPGVLYNDIFTNLVELKPAQIFTQKLVETCSYYKLPINKSTPSIKVEFGFYNSVKENFDLRGELFTIDFGVSVEEALNLTAYQIATKNICPALIETSHNKIVDDIFALYKTYAKIKV